MRVLRAPRSLVATLTCVLLAVGLGAAAAPASAEYQLPIAYDVSGTTHVGSGVNADLPLGPATLNIDLGASDGKLTSGTLPLPPSEIYFKALGLVPLRSTVSFIQSGAITGKITANGTYPTVAATAKYTIKLTNIQVDVLGLWVDLGVGSNCQTKAPSTLKIATPAGQSFDTTSGGTLTGTYTIGQFSNCAPLHLPDIFGIGSLAVNSLVPGSNNTISLVLSNGRITGQ